MNLTKEKMKDKVHIGMLIQEKVKEKKMTATQFSKLLHCSRSGVYNIFNSHSIDIKQLAMISEILDYDFIGTYQEKRNKDISKLTLTIEYCDGKFNVTEKSENNNK